MDHLVISKSIIRPSSEAINHLKPFKLSFFDQLVPNIFVPTILFYPAATHAERAQISAQLKTSLSKTLSIFYPFSGRLKNNTLVDNYEEGVPYTETRVKGSLKDVLKQPQLELIKHQFLPRLSISSGATNKEEEAAVALIHIQVNFFDCGGVGIGVSLSHKIFDASTASTFLQNWAAIARAGSCNDQLKITPGIFETTSLRFPPQNESLVKPYLSMAERYFFREGKYITKRFVFRAKAVADLRAKAKDEGVLDNNPSRTEILSSFIWKSYMEASTMLSSSPRMSLVVHPMDIRHLLQPRFSRYSIGNFVTMAAAAYHLPADEKMKFSDLVALTRRAIKDINLDHLQGDGDEAFRVISNSLKQQADQQVSSKNDEKLFFTSMLNFGFDDLDFGWGKPVWLAIFGEAGSEKINKTIIKNAGWNGEDIEAWMTLDERIMSIIENDPQFLEIATPNPSIIIPSCRL